MNQSEILVLIESAREAMHLAINEKCDLLVNAINNGVDIKSSEKMLSAVLPLNRESSYFKSKKPIRTDLGNGRIITTPTWKSVAETILKDCNSVDDRHKELMCLRNRVLGRNRVILSDKPNDMQIPIKIDEDLFFEAKYDTQTLMNVLKNRILDPAGYDYSSIRIEMYTPIHQSTLPTVSIPSEEFDSEEDDEEIGMTM